MIYHRSKDKILSRIGYYNDQKGIMNRYLREVQNWNEHLERTKKAILDGSVNKVKNKAIILGSGWLLDVPIDKLACSFREVWLADVYHPPQILKKAAQFPNIKFIQTELTGLAEQIYNSTKVYRKTKFKTPVTEFKPSFPIDLNQYDYVVSCNILSQLDVILTDYIKEYHAYTPEELDYLVGQIQKSHVDSLPRNKTVMICDMDEWMLDENENVIKTRPLVYIDLPGKETMSTWIWKFDTQMTYYESFNTYLNVASLSF